MTDVTADFTEFVIKRHVNVHFGMDPLFAARDLQQRWLDVERARGALDPGGASDEFVAAVQSVVRRLGPIRTPIPELSAVVRGSLAERLQARREAVRA